ncbi:DUF4913 domain-containing protein [Nocardiopsis sp. NPDC006198]|uniref:DUF4913 domain-containing protein n=1 Tax=Nocardiopsis sp. NPDC006198 TaxID=3154472 RepID=UPI0033B08CA2
MSTPPASAPDLTPEPESSGPYWDTWVKDMARQRVEMEEELSMEGAPTLLEDPAEEEDELVQDQEDIQDEDTGGEGEEEDGEVEPVFHSVEAWVNHHFLPMFRRVPGGENKWCPEWWRHAEAIARLDAMWRAWESLRLDDQTGMSTWFRDHADHHMPLLMGQNGPFRQCAAEHRETDQLESRFAPDGWWDGEYDEDEDE